MKIKGTESSGGLEALKPIQPIVQVEQLNPEKPAPQPDDIVNLVRPDSEKLAQLRSELMALEQQFDKDQSNPKIIAAIGFLKNQIAELE